MNYGSTPSEEKPAGDKANETKAVKPAEATADKKEETKSTDNVNKKD